MPVITSSHSLDPSNLVVLTHSRVYSDKERLVRSLKGVMQACVVNDRLPELPENYTSLMGKSKMN